MNLTATALPCIVCGKALSSAVPASVSSGTNQPNDGLNFAARGNYGSTVFDPLSEDGAGYLEVSVCDACVVEKAKAGAVARVVTFPSEPIVVVEPFSFEGT